MDATEIIKELLEASKDEPTFRKRAAQWFPGIYGLHYERKRRTLLWNEPLEVWAFRAREMAGDPWWGKAVYLVGKKVVGTRPSKWWLLYETTAPILVLAGCIALEMKKESK